MEVLSYQIQIHGSDDRQITRDTAGLEQALRRGFRGVQIQRQPDEKQYPFVCGTATSPEESSRIASPEKIPA
jgi:hypothetical protein